MKSIINKISSGNCQQWRMAIVVVSTIFFLLTIKQGHNWGGDFALYIAHAINIATGHSYHDTGYLYNPYSYWYGPETYPPVFPLLLSVVYKIAGLDLSAMRVLVVICFTVILVAFNHYCESRIENKKLIIAIIFMVAFSPYFWDIKNSVVSDLPYTMFLYAALITSDKLDDVGLNNKDKLKLASLFGFLNYLAYGTRSVGLIIVIAFSLNQVIKNRSFPLTLVVAISIFFILFVSQNIFLHSDASYMDAVIDNEKEVLQNNFELYVGKIKRIIQSLFNNTTVNTIAYIKVMKWYWQEGSNSIIGGVATIVTVVLSIYGYIYVLKRKISTGEIYFFINVILLIIVPFFQGFRYLIPIFPLYALYTFKSFDEDASIIGRKYRQPLALTLFVLIAVIYLVSYTQKDYAAYTYGPEKKETVQLFDYIKNETPKNSVVIFQKPRLMALFGERKSTTYFYNDCDEFETEGFLNFIKRKKITHLVVSNNIWGVEEINGYVKWVNGENEHIKLVYKNNDYKVFAIIKEKSNNG